MRVYDAQGREHTIDVIKERDHYTIEVNGHFFCSCDNNQEVNDEIPGIMSVYNFYYMKED
jgi:hypothetical protein